MSVSLTKGESVDLQKANNDAGSSTPLATLKAGAGWDGKADAPIDLDLLAVLIGDDGKALPDENGNGTNLDEAVVFFNNLTLPGAKHSGDNRTGEGDGDDETITFDLAALPAKVKEVAVVVASYSGETFDQVANASVRMVNDADGTEIAKYSMTDMGSTKGVELGRIIRKDGNWEFKATGTPISGEFKDVVASYGVTGL